MTQGVDISDSLTYLLASWRLEKRGKYHPSFHGWALLKPNTYEVLRPSSSITYREFWGMEGNFSHCWAACWATEKKQKKTPTAKRNPDLRRHINLELAAPFTVRYDTRQQACVLATSDALLLRGEIMACRGSLTSALVVLLWLKRPVLNICYRELAEKDIQPPSFPSG